MTKKDPAEKAVRDIRRKTRKQYSAEEKIRIVLSGLRGEESIAALCRHEGIAEGLYYSWSKEFLEAGKKRLAGDTARQATSTEVKTLRAETRDLKEALAEEMPDQVRNLNVEVKEWRDEIVFLHRIVSGSADKSYGIHVARLAGIPAAVLDRARGILAELETGSTVLNRADRSIGSGSAHHPSDPIQPGLFDQQENLLRDRLKLVDPDDLTPRMAQEFLYQLRTLLDDGERTPH